MKVLLPATPAIFLFGAGFGALAAQSIGAWSSVLMSLVVFAGSSQMAALAVWDQPNALIAIASVTLGINCRHLAFGATLAGRLRGLERTKIFASLAILSDLNWAATMASGLAGKDALFHLVGGGLLLWGAWVAGTAAGAIAPIDARAIEWLGIDALMPAFFACVLVGQWRNRRSATRGN